MVGFVGDFPASSYALDIPNHNSLFPGTDCFFPANKCVIQFRYSYTSLIRSQNVLLARRLTRTTFIRNVSVTKQKSKRLVIKEGTTSDVLKHRFAPFIKLSAILLSAREFNPKTCWRKPVVCRIFHAHNNKIVALDHFLTGIGTCILELCFLEINELSLCSNLDLTICFAIQETGMVRQATL